MRVTSVSGHLLSMDFEEKYQGNWAVTPPIELITSASIIKKVPSDMSPLEFLLKSEARRADWLILWLDCDREGENIAFEVIDVCASVKSNLRFLRARFSSLSFNEINKAIHNLVPPNKNLSDAVEARQELDLRLGVSFTRLQTLRLQMNFNFIGRNVICSWARGRLFDKTCTLIIYEALLDNSMATITAIRKKDDKKYSPFPMNTIILEKCASIFFHMSASNALAIAEKLYNKGYISYPRTETQTFGKMSESDIKKLITVQTSNGDTDIQEYANRLLNSEFRFPKKGKGDDSAHPPIHPLKSPSSLEGQEKMLMNFIIRYFLAVCSKDAILEKIRIECSINYEIFYAYGTRIKERNYLDVYPYDRVKESRVILREGQTLPTHIEMKEGKTEPPPLLSESMLIHLMDKNGIGTDATIAEHINKIIERKYCSKVNDVFVPTPLGIALIEGYKAIDDSLVKPNLRSEFESSLRSVSEGIITRETLLANSLHIFAEKYRIFENNLRRIDEFIIKYCPNDLKMDESNIKESRFVRPCDKCQSPMMLKPSSRIGYIVSCTKYPQCKHSYSLPFSCQIEISSEICSSCTSKFQNNHSNNDVVSICFLLDIVFIEKPIYYLPNQISICVACDIEIQELGQSMRSTSPLIQPKNIHSENSINKKGSNLQSNGSLHSALLPISGFSKSEKSSKKRKSANTKASGEKSTKRVYSKRVNSRSKYSNYSNVTCFKCHKHGHYANACPSLGTGSSSTTKSKSNSTRKK